MMEHATAVRVVSQDGAVVDGGSSSSGHTKFSITMLLHRAKMSRNKTYLVDDVDFMHKQRFLKNRLTFFRYSVMLSCGWEGLRKRFIGCKSTRLHFLLYAYPLS
jgi:hypothetical protein